MPRPRARTHPRTPVQPHPRTDMPAPFAVLQRVLACLRAPWHVSLHVTHERASRRGFAAPIVLLSAATNARETCVCCTMRRLMYMELVHIECGGVRATSPVSQSRARGLRLHAQPGVARGTPRPRQRHRWCPPLPHLHRSDWAHPAHIRSGPGSTRPNQ